MIINFLGFSLEIPDLARFRQFMSKNERNKMFLSLNTPEARGVADSKYKTKLLLSAKKVPVPKLMAKLATRREVERFDWEKLAGNFVIKPGGGYGGEGILIIRGRAKASSKFVKMDKRQIGIQELKLHCMDILAGKYSLHSKPDVVLVEERVKIHPKFFAYTRSGTPDVRIILYNKIPVMAMLRLPTDESLGRANLEQGAMGLGIDMASGLTTYGVAGKSKLIDKIYNFRKQEERSVSGIRIPEWRSVVETGIKCAMAMPGLTFLGVDVVLDKEKGPVVLEVNARPGLSIQICNKAGLKGRIDKVGDVQVSSVAHAWNMARYLFGEKVEVKSSKDTFVVKPIERIEILAKGEHKAVRAKVDTGAFRSSIDKELAQKIGLLAPENILYLRHFKSALGKEADRPVIGVTFLLAGRKVRAQVSVANRKKLKTKFLIGRKDLRGFVVKLATSKTKVKDFIKKIK